MSRYACRGMIITIHRNHPEINIGQDSLMVMDDEQAEQLAKEVSFEQERLKIAKELEGVELEFMPEERGRKMEEQIWKLIVHSYEKDVVLYETIYHPGLPIPRIGEKVWFFKDLGRVMDVHISYDERIIVVFVNEVEKTPIVRDFFNKVMRAR